MGSLSDAKVMGGIGAILVLLTGIPNFGWILGIIGFVLILIAMKYISDAVQDRKIFSDMMISVALAIVAIAVAGIAVVAAVFSLLGLGTFTGDQFVINPNVQPGDWIGFALSLIVPLVAIWILFIVSAVFIRRSLEATKDKLNVRWFGTAGLIYLIGAITVIIGVGFLLIIVAEVLLAIAFFSIQERRELDKPVQYA